MKIKKITHKEKGLIELVLSESYEVKSCINIYDLKSLSVDVISHRKAMLIDKYYDDMLQLKGMGKIYEAIQKVKSIYFEKDKGLQQYLISILSEIARINDDRNYNIEIVEELENETK